jgi:hypothetical protein
MVIGGNWEQHCNKPRLCMKLCTPPHLFKAYMGHVQPATQTGKEEKGKLREFVGEGWGHTISAHARSS